MKCEVTMRNPNSSFRILLSFLFALAACSSAGAALTEDAPSDVRGGSYAQPLAPASGQVISPDAFRYLGAFRLPGGEDPPLTFAYGGNAMTFNPSGDPSAAEDGHTGSLFIMGHDRIAYGGLPDGNQVAEVSIPQPLISRDLEGLNTAEFLQDFQDVLAGAFTDLEEIPHVGMAYFDHPLTGALLHFAWAQHLQEPGEPTHGWFSADLNEPDLQGTWYIGEQPPYSLTGYIFPLPVDWADAHTGGRYLASGRMRDGGQGGMGPALFAYTPWEENGSAPSDHARIEEVPLLLYENAYNTEEIVRCLNGYQHPDEWEGGAFLTNAAGDQAVLFSGTKSTGDKYWYGYMHPDGAQYACVDSEVTDFTTCRLADGSPCPAADFSGCCSEASGGCITNRGWWSTRFDAQLMLYDPSDLARVAAGEIEPWQPQPYAVIDVDDVLYLDPPEWDEVNLGWGDQRRYRLGDASFDPASGMLYVLELYADGAKPVVHVWQVQ